MAIDNDGNLFSQLLSQVQAQRTQAETVVGVAGGGAVRIELQGFERVVAVAISPEAMDDAESLNELVMSALNNAFEQAKAQNVALAGKLLGGFSMAPAAETEPPH